MTFAADLLLLRSLRAAGFKSNIIKHVRAGSGELKRGCILLRCGGR
jgi:hypothetical protein